MHLGYFKGRVPHLGVLLLIVSPAGMQACRAKEPIGGRETSAIAVTVAAAEPDASDGPAVASAPPASSAVSAEAASPVRAPRLASGDTLTGVYTEPGGGEAFLFESGRKLVGSFDFRLGQTICVGDFEAFKGTPRQGETFRYGPKYYEADGDLPPNTTAFSDAKGERGEYRLDVQDADCGGRTRGPHDLHRTSRQPFTCTVMRSTKLQIANSYDPRDFLQLKRGQRLQAFKSDTWLRKEIFVRLSNDPDKVGSVARADLTCDKEQ